MEVVGGAKLLRSTGKGGGGGGWGGRGGGGGGGGLGGRVIVGRINKVGTQVVSRYLGTR